MSKNIQNGSLKEAKTIQNTPMGAAKRPPKGYFAKFGFFEAAILYIFGHIPTIYKIWYILTLKTMQQILPLAAPPSLSINLFKLIDKLK